MASTRVEAARAAAVGDYTRLTPKIRIHLCMLFRIRLLCHCLRLALLGPRHLMYTLITSGCFLIQTRVMTVILRTL